MNLRRLSIDDKEAIKRTVTLRLVTRSRLLNISDVANVQINLGDTTNGTQETYRTYMVYAF